MNFLERVHKKLIVSCQALADEPLHSSFIMGKMALAAKLGGASGIRANTVEDIKVIKQEVQLPIIGIIKKDYAGSNVFITATMNEIDALYEEGVDVIALDGTKQERPDGKTFAEFFAEIREKYPKQLFMADTATLEEAIEAEKIGVDIVAPTLAGYTPYSEGAVPLALLEKMAEHITIPIIAEGNFDTPEKAKKALELGAHAVVVGSAITRPKSITEKFVNEIQKINQIN
ncbi:N-acylglucosamine-6-phosphate 2-epimerase [Scopulibacillus darangshiensis]|uniref:Putative N-acetylmannosamine-6-phosphate 2-epimerase n=1 Tax=Scopulibacillus darangshiensis TaxID=442528 RepID=A0A4R2NVF3_9BACL|nr:N-acetylmannosamine-6-phosphate 2-epimerase [Scopulibacillus darangshiensis]TCP25571.1 N-acylglucosamine-6-phosphate 2-epimerase [Scopulibacillus darangshiensis]